MNLSRKTKLFKIVAWVFIVQQQKSQVLIINSPKVMISNIYMNHLQTNDNKVN